MNSMPTAIQDQNWTHRLKMDSNIQILELANPNDRNQTCSRTSQHKKDKNDRTLASQEQVNCNIRRLRKTPRAKIMHQTTTQASIRWIFR